MIRVYLNNADISDTVIKINGLSRRVNYDYSMVNTTTSISICGVVPVPGDILIIKLNGTSIFRLIIESVEYDYDKYLYNIKAVNYLSKLSDYSVQDVRRFWFTDINNTMADYKAFGYTYEYWDESYVSVIHFIKSVMKQCLNVDVIDSVGDLASPYNYNNSIMRYRNIGLQLKQIEFYGCTDNEDRTFSNLYDVVVGLLQLLQVQLVFHDNKYYLLPVHYRYFTDADLIFKIGDKKQTTISSFSVSQSNVELSKLFDLTWIDEDVSEADYRTDSPTDTANRSLSIIDNLELYYLSAPTSYRIHRINDLQEQIAQVFLAYFQGLADTKEVTTLLSEYDYTCFCYSLKFDVRNCTMTYERAV